MIGDSTAKTRLLTKVHDSNLLVPRQSQLLPHGVRGRAELWLLCGYGAVASYRFGLLANLWFWPFAVGAGTGISYVPGAPVVHQPQQLPAVLAGDVDGGLGHPCVPSPRSLASLWWAGPFSPRSGG